MMLISLCEDNGIRTSFRMRPPLEHQVPLELQEAWAANRVLDDAQAALRRNRWRTFVIGEEVHVVVRRVEIGMVENIECIGFKLQLKPLFDQELLGQAR